MSLIPVRMSISPETSEKLEELTKLMQCATKTDAVARAIRIALILAQEHLAGGTLLLVKPDGSELELVLQ